jgi:hypothetical protein
MGKSVCMSEREQKEAQATMIYLIEAKKKVGIITTPGFPSFIKDFFSTHLVL